MIKIRKKAPPVAPPNDPERVSVPLTSRVSEASARSAEIRERKLAKQEASGRISVPVLLQYWTSKNKVAFPEQVPMLTDKDGLILQRHLKSLAAAGMKVLPYLDWVIENWRIIMSVRFKWMKDGKPEYPSVKFMVRFTDDFRAAYASKSEIEARAGLTLRDRMVADRMAKGQTMEAAEQEVEERLSRGRAQPKSETVAKRPERRERFDRVRKPIQPRQGPITGTGSFDEWK